MYLLEFIFKCSQKWPIEAFTHSTSYMLDLTTFTMFPVRLVCSTYENYTSSYDLLSFIVYNSMHCILRF